MAPHTNEPDSDDPAPPPGSPVLEALLENERNRQHLGQRLAAAGDRVDTDLLGDIVRHGPVLEALRQEPLDRGEIEERLDVSRATSHRFTQWLDGQGFVEKVDGRFQLTGRGEAVADEVLRFEANVNTVHRMAPLLDIICDDHQEFIVEPFVDATVTVAEPDDPYRPVERFISLVDESATFRGFNTMHMAPLVLGEFHQRVFDGTDTEIIYLLQRESADVHGVRKSEIFAHTNRFAVWDGRESRMLCGPFYGAVAGWRFTFTTLPQRSCEWLT